MAAEEPSQKERSAEGMAKWPRQKIQQEPEKCATARKELRALPFLR
jgi:hypothetical protein